MEPNVIQNIKDVINEYSDDLKGSVSNISSKIEFANSFCDSCIAKTMKEYLESIVGEIDKVVTYVDEFNSGLVVDSNDDNVVSDVVGNEESQVVEVPVE